ncbi:MAG: serine hydrolase [Ignavibacteriales bacterium]|nr:serine hydrolase [Ignavibacteriales bacterium]
MKRKIITYSILITILLTLSLLIKRYQFGWPDIAAAIGIIVLVLLFLIQLAFFKKRKTTFFVGLSAILFYVLILQLVYITWPQGLNGRLWIKANYTPYQWGITKPEEFGVNSNEINKELEKLKTSEFIQSFLIVKNGKLVVEEYFNGGNSNSAFNIKSCTKSILSALVGISIDKGYIKSVDDKMLDYFPEYKNQIKDSNYFKITIKDLLTMQEGLDVKPKTFKSFTIKEAMFESRFNKEKYKYFEYSSPSTEILSALVTKVSGMSLYDLADTELCKPIGINIRYWPKSSDGVNIGGADSYLTARDMARFGYLYLQNGNIDGKQIISEKWIKESTVPYDSLYSKYSCVEQTGYGYLWRIGRQSGYSFYSASGIGGQAIVIIPDLNLVMVFTHFWRNGEEWQKNEMEGDAFCRIIKMFE